MYCAFGRLCFPCPSSCFPASRPTLPFCNSAPTLFAGGVEMVPKRKASSSSAAMIPPIDPNSQLPFAGNHMSVVSELDLIHLVSIGVLPPKELCSWRICHGVTVPTEDTHESVIYVPFLLRGLALPISPFFHGLLDFYRLNLTHLIPIPFCKFPFTFIYARLFLACCHILDCGSTCITVALGWPGAASAGGGCEFGDAPWEED
jgi:hypothetical protein